ncbi:type II and III secretion system protein [Roseospirillum parvum]|uniref:Type II and III secretion system protein n=1 Tax=Roseospirillum parvum TaxID=83401 RepID=A0A1G8AJG3_9PROT|nr:type II and III secretion system protein [Roseospirillum parvum]SDH21152.1 type II and III secretion system protein [Roseospirillum parvum]
MPDQPTPRPATRLLAAALIVLGLGGCLATADGAPTGTPPPLATNTGATSGTTSGDDLGAMIAALEPDGDLEAALKRGVTHLAEGDYTAAGKAFEAGLRLEPANGHLHFLNALSYHLRGRAGEAKMLEFAKAGYRTALRFDESNAMAAYLLGQILFRQRDYVAAQNQFSYALLYDPENPRLLTALAAASYYSRDPETALWAAERAYRLAPEAPASIRTRLFAEAAAGRFDTAPRLLGEYRAAVLDRAGARDRYWADLRLEETDRRLREWEHFHLAASNSSIFGPASSDIVPYPSGPVDESDLDDTPTDQPGTLAPASDPLTEGAGTTDSTDSTQGQDAAAGKSGVRRPRMTNIDVVILRLDEVRAQRKGINLLDGLKTTLGGQLLSFEYSNTQGGAAGNSTSISYNMNPIFSLKGLEYNLNIFNDEMNSAEVLARPSLLATENATSTFFSGGVLHVQLSSNLYDGGLEDINIGITLSVTPRFLDEDTLSIDVKADHEFLEMQAAEVGFTAFSQTTKTSVQAKAVLRFGETLILSGLSQRGNEDSESGVPVLKDIPGIQYLFSSREELETKTSILILLTPHRPRYTEAVMDAEALDSRQDLERVYTDKLKSARRIANTNLNAVISHFNEDSLFYRQFRTGDIELRFFEDDDSIFGAIKRTLGFLYY